MINSLLIGKVIYKILSTNADLLERVQVKDICPLAANEQTVDFPFIIFGRTSTQPEYCKDGSIDDTVQIEFYINSRDYGESCEIANIVRNAFEMKRGEVEGVEVSHIRLIAAFENCVYEEGQITYIQTLTFEMRVC